MVFLGVYRAVYDYHAQSSEELEIKEGDLLFVLEKSTDDDWWTCKKKAASDDDEEPEGLVPNNYVEEAKPVHRAKALYDYTKQTDEELSFKEDEQLDVYDDTDPDWTLVGSNGQYGFAPAIYIESGAAAAATSTAALPRTRELAPAPAPAAIAAPAMPPRPPVDVGPIPGEADYVAPAAYSAQPPQNPTAHLASIMATRTAIAQPEVSSSEEPASSPLPRRPHFADEVEDVPQLPRRPPSAAYSSPSPPPQPQQLSVRTSEPGDYHVSSPHNRAVPTFGNEPLDDPLRSPGGFHLYNIHEMVTHMGKNKKMPTTLGINIAKGLIMISPEKSRDGPSKEWTAEKLTHYSIEGKHVFMELVRPSRSIDFHAGAKDTAQEIVSALGELAGAVRQEGLKEVIAASAGTGASGQRKGKMLYEFKAQSEDEVTVAAEDEVIILDDTKSDEWWMVRRIKTGKEGVVPSSYVEITGTLGPETIHGLNAARSTVEMNRLEEERLAREALKKNRESSGLGIAPPERNSSLAGDTRRTSMRTSDKRTTSAKDQPKTKPNTAKVRTWTDRSGTFKVDAEFIGLKDGKIHLHKVNGVKIAVPVSKMAVEDLEYVERATGTSLDEDKPLSDIKRRSTLKAKDKDKEPSARSGASIVKNEYDWFDFFLSCGVNPQICERYAGAFSRDQMSPEILPEVNEKLLRTLGLKEGDILRVMKFLNDKYGRKKAGGDDAEEAAAGGLFSGPGGMLRNNTTRKGRPAPAVQTNDNIDESAFKVNSDAKKDSAAETKATSAAAPARPSANGFDDDAWDVKPSRTVATPPVETAPAPVEPPKPKVNDDIALLSIASPPLQPTPAPQPAPVAQPEPPVQPAAPQQPAGANQAIFDKIASLAPAAQAQQPMMTGYINPQLTAVPRTRPAPPPQQQINGAMGIAPPPRATSAPGYPPQQSYGPLQVQLTGYQPGLPSIAPPGQSLQDLQQQQRYLQLQPQLTAVPSAYGQPYPAVNGVQSIQQNYPALQPQPTSFQPQSHFGQSQLGIQQTGYPQQPYMQGQPTGSPFADSSRPPFQPIPSGLSNSFSTQPTGFQPAFNISQPTGMGLGNQAPQAPPQQTGGVFGPSQPAGLQPPAAPLVAQKTGPAPPVRFGVQPGAKPLVPQPTGRANLAKATPQNPFGF